MARRGLTIAALLASIWVIASSAAEAQTTAKPDMQLVERGRYIAKTAGCNDCHTPGYNQALGKLDEQLWLTGDKLGWRGPWGTTYAPNLRLYVQNMTREQWLALVSTAEPRPPMPWFNLRAMSKADQSALFVFLKYLGPAGEPSPAWMGPEKTPPQPFVQFPG